MDPRRPRRPHHVLIAEDSDDLRALWRTCLTHSGFTVEEARNGQEALEKARAHTPDVIVMDCCMPVLDGLSAMLQIRRDPALTNVPMVALSAASAHTGAQAVKAGCDAFLAKPVMPDQLIERVQVLLRATKDH